MINKVGTVVESPIGSNSDMMKYIDSVNNKFGMKKQPWCAMLGSDALKQGKASYPYVWSALALSFARVKLKYTMKQVANNEYQPKPGDIIIYSYGAGKGHIDFVVSFENGEWLLVGGNRDNRVAYWKGSTNKLIMNKAKYVVDVSGDYTYDYVADDYSSMKLATVYHEKFHGRKMANGQVYNQWDYTVASNDYPLNTRITIKNTKNNKSVEAIVTDRMRDKNLVDLSLAISKKLGIRKDSVLITYKVK
jgi:rare lipoprotein A (peptidoglycan hydrolase)